MAEEPDPGKQETAVGTRTPTWSRVLIFGAATLAVLLVGATIGLVVGESTGEDPPRSPGADSVAVGFAQDMAVHHEQAVTMANWARGHSTDPAVRQLAFDIGSTQLEQIGRMKGWLMLWGRPEQPLGDYMTWMHGPGGQGGQGHGHGSMKMESKPGGPLMPGMATTEELAGLRAKQGRALDVEFLQLMLRHHQGGTDMARYAVEHAKVPALRTLAQSMLKSQGAEMDLMRRMLAERDAKPLPFP